MNRRTRITLLTVLIILFFLLAPQIILYSLGYRFDFEEKKFVNTGGLYLKIWPQRTEIFVDGKLIKKTGLFSGSILIQNLLPKKYEILIKKEGYHFWKKTLEIRKKEVVKAENIILIKENPVFDILAENIDDFPPFLDTEKSEKSKKDLPTLNNLITYEVFGNDIVWLADSGFLYKSDSSGDIIESFNIKPFPIKEDNLYEIIIHPETTFVKENETLFLLNPDSKVFEKFYAPVKNLGFSPDLKKIFYLNDYEIWFSYLSPKPEKIFLTRFSEKIEDSFWLNSFYLIFNVGDKIKISEIDNRDGINIVDLVEFSSLIESTSNKEIPKMFWNQNDKKLYLLLENTLFVSEELIP